MQPQDKVTANEILNMFENNGWININDIYDRYGKNWNHAIKGKKLGKIIESVKEESPHTIRTSTIGKKTINHVSLSFLLLILIKLDYQLFINLTEALKAKDIYIIEEIAKDFKNDSKSLSELKELNYNNKKDNIVHTKTGRKGGTYISKMLMPSLMRWLDPLKCFNILNNAVSK